MKKLILLSIFGSLLMNISVAGQGQTSGAPPDQLKSMDQFVGTWEGKTGEETSQIWEFMKNGKSVYAIIYGVKQNVKTMGSMLCYGYDRNENKIKGYSLHAAGNYSTWFLTFKSENMCCVEITTDWNPETIGAKYDCIFEKDSWRMISYDKEGTKTRETKFVRINQ